MCISTFSMVSALHAYPYYDYYDYYYELTAWLRCVVSPTEVGTVLYVIMIDAATGYGPQFLDMWCGGGGGRGRPIVPRPSPRTCFPAESTGWGGQHNVPRAWPAACWPSFPPSAKGDGQRRPTTPPNFKSSNHVPMSRKEGVSGMYIPRTGHRPDDS